MTTLYDNIFAIPMQMYWTIYLLQIYCVQYKIFYIANTLSATNPISNNYYCVLQIYWTIYLQYTIFHIANKSHAIHDIVYCKYIRQYNTDNIFLLKSNT